LQNHQKMMILQGPFRLCSRL